MYEVKRGDFILSGIDARNGAFGIVPAELDGAIVTNDFWYFQIDEAIINKALFLELTSTAWFDEICKRGSDGTTQRIRLQKDKFFNQEIYLPLPDSQQQLLTKIQSIKRKQTALHQQIIKQQELVKQLKQAILQEAIQGKLTENWRVENPDVESPSELLKRIKAEKQKLIAENKIRKEKPLPAISDEEIPFALPGEWVWCRLGEVYQSTSGGTPSRGNNNYWNGNITWYKSGELNDGYLSMHSKENISGIGLAESSATLFPKGTLLIAMYGATAGRLAVLEVEATTNQAICGFYENKELLTKYLFYFFMANRPKIIDESWGMSQPNISQTYLKNYIYALPPLIEQKAIIRKVETLMQKCTTLESEIKQSESHAKQLMQAVIKEAFEPDKSKEIS